MIKSRTHKKLRAKKSYIEGERFISICISYQINMNFINFWLTHIEWLEINERFIRTVKPLILVLEGSFWEEKRERETRIQTIHLLNKQLSAGGTRMFLFSVVPSGISRRSTRNLTSRRDKEWERERSRILLIIHGGTLWTAPKARKRYGV